MTKSILAVVDARLCHRCRLQGADLVVRVERESTKPLRFTLAPTD